MSTQPTTAPASAQVQWREVPTLIGYRASEHGGIQTRWQPGRSRGGVLRGKHPPTFGTVWIDVEPHNGNDGYLSLPVFAEANSTGKRTVFKVHRAVCLAFHGMPPPNCEAAHYPNQDTTDNRSCNLSWKTRVENAADKVENGTAPIGENNPRATVTDDDVRAVRRMRLAGYKKRQIVKALGIKPHTVYLIYSGKSWKHVR